LDELSIQKTELGVKKKKSQDVGCFLKTSCEDRDKEISERNEGNPRQDLNPHQWIKRGFLPPPADKPTPYPPKISSDRNPSGNPGEHKRNQRVNPETPNHQGKSLWKALLKYWAGLNILPLLPLPLNLREPLIIHFSVSEFVKILITEKE